MSAHYPAFLLSVPLASALLLPLIGMRSIRIMRLAAAAVLTALFGFSLSVLVQSIAAGPIHYHFGGWAPPYGIEFSIDPLSGMMASLVSFFSLLNFFGLEHEAENMSSEGVGPFYALYMLLTAGLMGISVTGDLFNLYVFLEISALSGYALVACGGDRAKVAAFRYLILGSVAATFWVIGLGYLYAATGTLNIADMASRLPAVMSSRAVLCGLAFITAGMSIKMALFPIHGWQPDAYTYAPAAVMPFISSIMAKVSAYVLFRVLYTVFQAGSPLQSANPAMGVLHILGWVGALSIVAGSILALAQSDIRRMLAYSSVAQIGYVVMGFSLGTRLALTGALLHLVYHALMKGCAFFAVAGIRARTGKTQIDDFAGLASRMPWTAAAFTVAAISMIGLPPTAGFFSKYYLATAAVGAGEWTFVAALAISSVLNAVYFFRVIERLYLQKSAEETPVQDAPRAFLIPAVALAGMILALGLANQSMVNAVIAHALPAGLAP